MHRASGFLSARVTAIVTDPLGGPPLAVLELVENGEPLLVPIGMADARALRVELDNIALDRMMTHQLAVEMLRPFGNIRRVELVAFDGCRVIAHMVVACGEGVEHVHDCRVSDALAMALRAEADILVAPLVAEELTIRHRELAEDWGTAGLGDPLSGLDWADNDSPPKWRQ